MSTSSKYEDLKTLVDSIICPTCSGSGKCSNADHDIYTSSFNSEKWLCPDCKGTGFKDGVKHVAIKQEFMDRLVIAVGELRYEL